jgi:hypothetical protein
MTMTKMVRVNDKTYADMLTIGEFRETMDQIISKCVKCYKEKNKK